jgi:hypothetical protein
MTRRRAIGDGDQMGAEKKNQCSKVIFSMEEVDEQYIEFSKSFVILRSN